MLAGPVGAICQMGCGLCLLVWAWLGWEVRGEGTQVWDPGLQNHSPLEGTVTSEAIPKNPAALLLVPQRTQDKVAALCLSVPISTVS